jgi:signal transduction histidine kinase
MPAPSATPSDFGRVRAVIDALPEAVFVTDHDGWVRLTNPAADDLFATQPVHHEADLLSRFEVVGPDAASRSAPRSVPDDGSAPVTVRPRDQPNRWYALRTIPLDGDLEGDARSDVADTPVPGIPGVAAPAATRRVDRDGNDDTNGAATGRHEGATVFVLRDVTDSRDFQPERAAFLSVLSHELRTPITTIYAGSSVLARRPSLAPPASRILARDISAEAARLYDLVEDLLVLARLERQVLDLSDEPVFLQRAVHATIRMALGRQPDASIQRTGVATPPPVHGDATYVEQACRNLILTSLRFAGPEPDRALVVELRVDAEAGEVAMAVLDRGPDLTSDELDRAFELPDPAAADRLAGAGIGPFVCRHLVEAMGGRVWARNREDGRGGLELGFALPVDERG